MNSDNIVTTPQTIAEVEQLVKRLYKPGSTTLVTEISDHLLHVQLSQDGWKVADELMVSDDANVRFFGALTFTIKLNNDGSVFDPELSTWASLDAATAELVLSRLIFWLVCFSGLGEGGLVCKKLCSALTAYYIRSPSLWKAPLLHLGLSFQQGRSVTELQVDQSQTDMSAVLLALSDSQLQILLWFAGDLAEELGRVSSTIPALARLHTQMETIVEDAGRVMGWCMAERVPIVTSKTRAEALKTFRTWINYAQPVWPHNRKALQPLRSLLPYAAYSLTEETLQMEAVDIFRDILESYTTFFEPDHMDMLARMINEHIRPKLLHALIQQDPEGLPFGQLVIAFGCANIQQVVEQPGNQLGSAAIVGLHLDIMSANGYPGDDDQLSVQSIEFWNTYIEYVNDMLFSNDKRKRDPGWLDQSKYVMQQVVELLWSKMWTPSNEIAKEWGDAESEGFKDFRMDSTDLMLSIFVLRGKEMFQQLITLTLSSLEARQWRPVEAALLCLNSLADNVVEDPASEETMGDIFRSDLFREIGDFSHDIPLQARRTAIDLLGSYGQYIERHTEFLPDTLRFLFSSLEIAGLANGAAKSIASLCSTCRGNLTGELPGFLAQYERFLESKTSEPYTKEKVIGAIAAIIQALSPESAKTQPLLALLSNIMADCAVAKTYASVGDLEMAEVMAVTALECLASIGRGMQVPEDVPIDIYADERNSALPNFWESEEGLDVQRKIVGCLSVLQVVDISSAAIDAACQVLRSGYIETEPGPFVLPPSVTVSFVQQCSINTPQLDSVLSTACMLITQHSRKNAKRIDDEAQAILASVAGFAEALERPSNDPAAGSGCIDVLTRLMPHYSHVLFGEISASILDFTLSAIEGPDIFPKRSACDFWTKLIKPQNAPLSDDTRQRIDQVMEAYGPKFALSLARQLGGGARRSDLESLCEPLKALLLHQSRVQAWLQQGLTDASFPSTRVSMDDRAKFLRQISSTRSDGKRMKDLVKVFWAACRGTVVDY